MIRTAKWSITVTIISSGPSAWTTTTSTRIDCGGNRLARWHAQFCDEYNANMDSSPLAGVRVLDASRVLAGPFCGQMLGDLGAEVIKIERPGQGDETRTWGPPFAGALSAYYLSCNRNKKAITLDLGQPEGMRIFRELVGNSDVLLEN